MEEGTAEGEEEEGAQRRTEMEIRKANNQREWDRENKWMRAFWIAGDVRKGRGGQVIYLLVPLHVTETHAKCFSHAAELHSAHSVT